MVWGIWREQFVFAGFCRGRESLAHASLHDGQNDGELLTINRQLGWVAFFCYSSSIKRFILFSNACWNRRSCVVYFIPSMSFTNHKIFIYEEINSISLLQLKQKRTTSRREIWSVIKQSWRSRINSKNQTAKKILSFYCAWMEIEAKIMIWLWTSGRFVSKQIFYL